MIQTTRICFQNFKNDDPNEIFFKKLANSIFFFVQISEQGSLNFIVKRKKGQNC